MVHNTIACSIKNAQTSALSHLPHIAVERLLFPVTLVIIKGQRSV